ncbi:MAG: S1 family peptidase [Pseudobdellovibrionaceae bacterium]|nr:S1 family peptidase [Pseudobdellovibrionaceae bacterium]
MTSLIKPFVTLTKSAAVHLTLLFFAFALNGCRHSKREVASDLHLAGGTVAQRSEFAGALALLPGGGLCSGVKISDTTILTAAHCVIDYTEKVEYFKAGDELSINSGIVLDGKELFKVKVKKISVHPTTKRDDCIASETVKRYESCIDLAVIEIEPSERFKAEKTATVGSNYNPKAHDHVFIGGYGCEAWNGKFEPVFSDENPRQKFGEVEIHKVYPASIAFASGPASKFADKDGNPLTNPKAILGCPGDSGGPVYLADKTTVVAVTSGAVESGIDAQKGFLSYYSRVDSHATLLDGNDLGSWLLPILGI